MHSIFISVHWHTTCLYSLNKRILHVSWQKHTIQTIRYKLYHIAGKVVYHARQIVLKVDKVFVDTINHIRHQCYLLSLE